MDTITKACMDKDYGEGFSIKLKSKFIGKKTIFIARTTSTNQIAKEKMKVLENGTVLIADEQTGGQGRKRRTWFSPKGKGLWFTIIIKEPGISAKKLPLINLMTSVVIAESICKISRKVEIKWPNDLLWKGKKICGILSEVKKSNTGIILIVGIGINTGKNMSFPKELSIKATSLELEKDNERELLLKDIIEGFERGYNSIVKNETGKILKKWKDYSITLKSKLYLPGSGREKFPCKAIGVGLSGELIVEDIYGKRNNIYIDEEIIQIK